jgi:uncharacterized protein YbaR (Trm112 family)
MNEAIAAREKIRFITTFLAEAIRRTPRNAHRETRSAVKRGPRVCPSLATRYRSLNRPPEELQLNLSSRFQLDSRIPQRAIMISPSLLKRLRCPVTHAPLRELASDEVHTVNAAISRGEARDGAHAKVELEIESGLVSPTGDLVYPIRNGIPTLVADEAIRRP